MPPSAIFRQLLLPKTAVQLGRFTTSIEQPQQNYWDPPIDSKVLTSGITSWRSSNVEGNKSKLDLSLTSLLSVAFSRRTRSKITVETSQVCTYTLDNSESWFEKAATLMETKRWMERQFDRSHDIYMIVGIHTVTDAKISQQAANQHGAGGKVTAPVGLALKSAGIVIPFGDLLDPAVGIHREVNADGRVQFLAPGEQVCAMQYVKVRQRWFSRNFDRLTLSGVQYWQSLEVNRGAEDEDDDEDIIGVDLQELGSVDNWTRIGEGDDSIIMPSVEG
jgi:hypothetical protein